MNANDIIASAISADPNAGSATEVKSMPEGRYSLVIEDIGQRKYVDGTGRKPEQLADACTADPTIISGDEVHIVYSVTDGEFSGRKLYGDYCIKASSNQRAYPNFSVEDKVRAGLNDLAGIYKRLGRLAPGEGWKNWVGVQFIGYVKAKKDKPKLDSLGNIVEEGKIRNSVRCTIKEGEDLTAKPAAPKGTATVESDSAPF